jgi:hypothetical protein
MRFPEENAENDPEKRGWVADSDPRLHLFSLGFWPILTPTASRIAATSFAPLKIKSATGVQPPNSLPVS